MLRLPLLLLLYYVHLALTSPTKCTLCQEDLFLNTENEILKDNREKYEHDSSRTGHLYDWIVQKFQGSESNNERSENFRRKIDDSATPIVIWHGLGQTSDDPNEIGRVKSLIENVTNSYVYSIRIGATWVDDLVNSYFKPANDQVAEACRLISNNTWLRDGYFGIGFSQGGILLRGVAQRCPNPPMKRLITMGSPHQGIFGIPRCPGGNNAALCLTLRNVLNLGAYTNEAQNGTAPAQYWHDTLDYETFLNKSRYIADLNNLRNEKNPDYKRNLIKLERFVMVKNFNDLTVYPKESQHFEFYPPGSDKQVTKLKDSPLYIEDWIGLKTLDASGKLILIGVEGGHIQYNISWFVDNIVYPHLMD